LAVGATDRSGDRYLSHPTKWQGQMSGRFPARGSPARDSARPGPVHRSGERLRPDDGQQSQLVVAVAAGSGGVDEQGVRLVGVEQPLTGQLEGTDFGMDEVLDLSGAYADLVVVPDLPELR